MTKSVAKKAIHYLSKPNTIKMSNQKKEKENYFKPSGHEIQRTSINKNKPKKYTDLNKITYIFL